MVTNWQQISIQTNYTLYVNIPKVCFQKNRTGGNPIHQSSSTEAGLDSHGQPAHFEHGEGEGEVPWVQETERVPISCQWVEYRRPKALPEGKSKFIHRQKRVSSCDAVKDEGIALYKRIYQWLMHFLNKHGNREKIEVHWKMARARMIGWFE